MSKLTRLITFAKNMHHWMALSGADSDMGRAGWFRSRSQGMPVDANNEPIPWITYSCLRFLEGRVRPDMAVFEYGSGSSTLWWARRVRSVISCEHDSDWFERTRALVPENVQLTHASAEGQQYSREILKYQQAFDILVIDGRDRVACARNSLAALKAQGVVVWDNSDRDEYQPGYAFLVENGFRRIDFSGMGPINVYGWSTSIFYRDENCLGL